MSREQVAAFLREMEPKLVEMYRRRAAMQGATAGQAGARVGR
jgi:hypothetical protein